MHLEISKRKIPQIPLTEETIELIQVPAYLPPAQTRVSPPPHPTNHSAPNPAYTPHSQHCLKSRHSTSLRIPSGPVQKTVGLIRKKARLPGAALASFESELSASLPGWASPWHHGGLMCVTAGEVLPHWN